MSGDTLGIDESAAQIGVTPAHLQLWIDNGLLFECMLATSTSLHAWAIELITATVSVKRAAGLLACSDDSITTWMRNGRIIGWLAPQPVIRYYRISLVSLVQVLGPWYGYELVDGPEVARLFGCKNTLNLAQIKHLNLPFVVLPSVNTDRAIRRFPKAIVMKRLSAARR